LMGSCATSTERAINPVIRAMTQGTECRMESVLCICLAVIATVVIRPSPFTGRLHSVVTVKVTVSVIFAKFHLKFQHWPSS
jgi:hypothetical protein